MGEIVVDDSELYLTGKGGCSKNITFSHLRSAPEWCMASDDGTTWTDIQMSQLPEHRSINLGYRCDTYFHAAYDTDVGITYIERADRSQYEVPGCEVPAPEGKHFKSWMMDGSEEVHPGDTIDLSDRRNVLLVAQWENDPEPGPEPHPPIPSSDDSTGLIIGGVIVAIIAILAFAMVWVTTRK